MKKTLLFVLTLAMLLSLCACSGSGETPNTEATTPPVEESTDTQKPTMEELLSTATEIDGYTFFQEYDDNKVKHSSDYNEKVCLVEGTIYEIEADHIAVTDSNLKVNIYLPTEEIVELQKGQYVEIVGIVENIGFEQNMSLIWVTVDFNTGYIVNTVYEKTGQVMNSDYTVEGKHTYELLCKNSQGNNYFVILELTAEQAEPLTAGQEITVEGNLFLNNTTLVMRNITIK